MGDHVTWAILSTRFFATSRLDSSMFIARVGAEAQRGCRAGGRMIGFPSARSESASGFGTVAGSRHGHGVDQYLSEHRCGTHERPPPTLANLPTSVSSSSPTRDHTNVGGGPQLYQLSIGAVQRHVNTRLLLYSEHCLNAHRFHRCGRQRPLACSRGKRCSTEERRRGAACWSAFSQMRHTMEVAADFRSRYPRCTGLVWSGS